jgi:hypothetical protein
MSRTTHAISYGDTPAMRTDMDFKYIRYGVTGSSKAVYDFRGGGHVKTGLLAGAKANMMQQHPLQINQAYINMSVDILNTETRRGHFNDYEGGVTKHIVIKAVVSADIIEYIRNPDQTQTINSSTGVISDYTITNQHTNQGFQSEVETEVLILDYEVGQLVYIKIEKVRHKGKVKEVITSEGITSYYIDYEDRFSGETKSKITFPQELSPRTNQD